MNIESLISDKLRSSLREHGWSKLAYLVMLENGECPPTGPSLKEAAEALCTKLAVNKVNRFYIQDGVRALRELSDE